MNKPPEPGRHAELQIRRTVATYIRADTILSAAAQELGAEIENAGIIRHSRWRAIEHAVETGRPDIPPEEREPYINRLISEARRTPIELSAAERER